VIFDNPNEQPGFRFNVEVRSEGWMRPGGPTRRCARSRDGGPAIL